MLQMLDDFHDSLIVQARSSLNPASQRHVGFDKDLGERIEDDFAKYLPEDFVKDLPEALPSRRGSAARKGL